MTVTTSPTYTATGSNVSNGVVLDSEPDNRTFSVLGTLAYSGPLPQIDSVYEIIVHLSGQFLDPADRLTLANVTSLTWNGITKTVVAAGGQFEVNGGNGAVGSYSYSNHDLRIIAPAGIFDPTELGAILEAVTYQNSELIRPVATTENVSFSFLDGFNAPAGVTAPSATIALSTLEPTVTVSEITFDTNASGPITAYAGLPVAILPDATVTATRGSAVFSPTYGTHYWGPGLQNVTVSIANAQQGDELLFTGQTSGLPNGFAVQVGQTSITLTASGLALDNTGNQTVIDDFLHSIEYENASNTPPSSTQIGISFFATSYSQDAITYYDPIGFTGPSSLTVNLAPSVVTVAQFFAGQAGYDASGAFTITDTAANVVAALDALQADGHVVAIQLTDDDNLPVTSFPEVQQFVADDADVLAAIFDTDGYTFELTKDNANGGTTSQFYDINGIRQEVQTHDSTGQLIVDTFYFSDGTHEALKYHIATGPYASSDSFYDANGAAFSITEYYASGDPYYVKVVNPDDSGEAQYYDTSGNVLTETDINADHSYTVWHYQLADRPYDYERTIHDANGGITEQDGFTTGATEVFSHIYNSDGSSSSTVFDANGSPLSEIVYNADHSKDVYKFGISDQDYTSYHAVYGTNGQIESISYDDGMSRTWTYGLDGALVSRDYENVTGQAYTAMVVTYGPTGAIATTDTTKLDGTHSVSVRAADLTVTSSAAADTFTSFGHDDTFTFNNPSFGHDTITHFNAASQDAHDVIAIDHTVAASVDALTITQAGHDTLITVDALDSILVKNTQAADVQHDITIVV